MPKVVRPTALDVAKKLETDVYFCNSYASYQRGLNE